MRLLELTVDRIQGTRHENRLLCLKRYLVKPNALHHRLYAQENIESL